MCHIFAWEIWWEYTWKLEYLGAELGSVSAELEYRNGTCWDMVILLNSCACNPWRIHGAAIYMVTWIPSIYPLYVSINIAAPWILWVIGNLGGKWSVTRVASTNCREMIPTILEFVRDFKWIYVEWTNQVMTFLWLPRGIKWFYIVSFHAMDDKKMGDHWAMSSNAGMVRDFSWCSIFLRLASTNYPLVI